MSMLLVLNNFIRKRTITKFRDERSDFSNIQASNNDNNASISIAQNKLSSVVLTAVQIYMSLVFWQKSAEKRTQSEC